MVSPKHSAEINSIKDLANKKIGVSAPGSSTDFFLKYILKKNGVDPNSIGVIGVGLGQTATGGAAGPVTDTTSQTSTSSADGGSNTNGSFTATQTANPTTTTTSNSSQGGSTGRGGDTYGALNKTGDAVSGANTTAAVGGDVIASQTGAGNAAGGAGTGGAASANGGTATSGPATVSNTATVSQASTQNMTAWDNDNWVSIWAIKKKHYSW